MEKLVPVDASRLGDEKTENIRMFGKCRLESYFRP